MIKNETVKRRKNKFIWRTFSLVLLAVLVIENIYLLTL